MTPPIDPRPRPAALAAAICLAVPGPLGAALPLYSVTPLDEAWVPEGFLGAGLNGSGQVHSYDPASTTGSHALLDGAGFAQVLDTPPPGWPAFSSASRANLTDGGSTAVTVFSQTGKGTVGIGDFPTGTIRALEAPPPNGDDDWSPRISGDGSFIVIQAGPESGMLEPYRYDSANGWQPLGNLVAGGDGRPLAVSSSGTVVGRTGGADGGTVPFYYTIGGGMAAITDGGQAVFGEATAINGGGLVTGTANGRAFLFDSTSLEFLFLTEDITGWRARDINDSGSIIGSNGLGGVNLGVPGGSAFYWDDSLDAATSLDNVIGDAIDDWFITDALDINDDGWILGTAYRQDEGVFYGVLLRPIPEPAASLLVLAAAAFLGRRRRKGAWATQ